MSLRISYARRSHLYPILTRATRYSARDGRELPRRVAHRHAAWPRHCAAVSRVDVVEVGGRGAPLLSGHLSRADSRRQVSTTRTAARVFPPPPDGFLSKVKRVVVGAPLATEQLAHERLGKP